MKMKKFKIDVDGKKYEVGVDELSQGNFSVELDNKKYNVLAEEIIDESEQKKSVRKSASAGSKSISAPITGTIGKINVKDGDTVNNGDIVLTLIAMKMENEIKATLDGKVKEINVKVGQNVDVGELLIELE